MGHHFPCVLRHRYCRYAQIIPRWVHARSSLMRLFPLFAASTASGYNLGFKSMIRDLECTTFQATLGLSLYALGFGLFPLVTASFSEEFGRQPLYYASALGFFLMFVMIAEYVFQFFGCGLFLTSSRAKNIATVVVGRFLQGCFGSTWATMVGE